MKALAILFRLVFSILVLIAIACYLQVSPTATLSNFCSSIDTGKLIEQLCGLNYLTISLGAVVLLSIFSITRLLDAIWNMLFCASILVLLAGGLYTLCGPGIALPNAIYQNEAVNQVCQSILNYEVPLAITMLIFVAGWICASACGRVAITAVISYGLWYAITEFFTYTTHLWADNAAPALPEALYMIQSSPWILAAVPGAFFLIYALFMAFFETYISNTRKKSPETGTVKAEEKPAETKPAETPASQPAPESKKEEKPVLKPVEPATKTQPLLKTTSGTPVPPKKLKLATPAAAEKPADKKEEKPAPKAETKPAEAEKTVEQPKEEVKPAPEPEKKDESKPGEKTEEAEKTVEKPSDTEKTATSEAKAEEKPSTEPEKSAEEKKEDAPAKE